MASSAPAAATAQDGEQSFFFKVAKRTSSVFKSALNMFGRTGGNQGASVEKLRGTKGADFEATCIVRRGGTQRLFGVSNNEESKPTNTWNERCVCMRKR